MANRTYKFRGTKQLSESKRQSELLQKIAENTERQSGKSELLMK